MNQVPVTSRRSLLKLAGSLGAAATIAASLAACGAPSDPSTSPTAAPSTGDASSAPASSAADAGTITAGISYELGTNGYDPMTTTAALTVAANWHTMEGLTEIHPATREVYAALGADLPTQDGGRHQGGAPFDRLSGSPRVVLAHRWNCRRLSPGPTPRRMRWRPLVPPMRCPL